MSSVKHQLAISFAVLACFNSYFMVYASIINYTNELNPNGYYFRYKTNDGVERNEEGTLKSTDAGNVLSVAGSYEYESDGVITVVTYIADENGFRPLSQVRRKVNNQLPIGFTLDNRIDPKLLGSLAGGGLG